MGDDLMVLYRDNMEADILGANLYRRYLSGVVVPEPRRLPSGAALLPQTVRRVESILVSTGVHRSNVDSGGQQTAVGDDLGSVAGDLGPARQGHCHRDFVDDVSPELFLPTLSVDTVSDAVGYILQQQQRKQSDKS